VDQLLHPLPSQSEIDEFSPEKREQNFGKVKLQCVMLSQKIVRLAYAPLGLFPTYCFSPEKPVLRFGTFSGGVQVIFNKLALFQGRYFAQQIAISDRTIALADISVDSLTGIPAIKSEDFDPPQNAVKGYESPQGVSAGVMAGRIARKTQPIYPQSAKANRISGKVLLDATIGRDGRIHRLKVVSSPDPDLSIASLAAVQQWSYQPYLLMGEPVEVNTQITVVFALGPR
jgi:TonB family protein